MPICKLERTDQYLDMYASRIEDRSKTEHSAQYTDTYVSRPPQDRMKRERTDQYTDMYVSRGDERTKLSGGIDCDMYTSCHGEHTELQADMLSPYSGEPMAGRGVPVYNSEHGGPMSGGGLQVYNGEPVSGRGMPVYNGERAEPVAGRGVPVYSGEHGEPTAERGVQLYNGEPATGRGVPVYNGEHGEPATGRGAPMYNGEHGEPATGRGAPMYNGEHGEPATGRGAPVYNGEHGEPATGRGAPVYNGEHGEPTTGRGVPVSQYSGTEREVTSQGAGVSSRPVPYIQCLKCKEKIRERHMVLLNDGRFLHERCLRCEVCLLTIHLNDDRGSVFLRDNKVYCRKDYTQLFSSEPRREMPCCIKCNVQLEKDNWVRRADNYLFHMTCFCCSKCSRQLSKWEQFVMREERLICEKHFYENDGSQKGDSPKPRAKRMRTSFTEEQVKVLQQHFAIDSNPDGQDLERIAKLTGLKKRVTQVWFQNNRARHKKSLQQNSGGQASASSLSSSFSPTMSTSAMYVSASEEGDSVQDNDLNVFPGDVDQPEDGSGHNDFAPQSFWSQMDN